MIFFRATTVHSAVDLMKGVVGLNGVSLPHGAAAIAATYGTDIKQAAMWVAILLFIALVCPNTLQILAPYETALGVSRPRPRRSSASFAFRHGARRFPGRLRFRPSPPSRSSRSAAPASFYIGSSKQDCVGSPTQSCLVALVENVKRI
jgi:hypothetical protein